MIVHESDLVLAFQHTRPSYDTHIVVVPKPHIESLTSLTEADEPAVRELLKVVREVARTVEISEGGARVTTNVGRYQESKHLHVHVVSGRVTSTRARRSALGKRAPSVRVKGQSPGVAADSDRWCAGCRS